MEFRTFTRSGHWSGCQPLKQRVVQCRVPAKNVYTLSSPVLQQRMMLKESSNLCMKYLLTSLMSSNFLMPNPKSKILNESKKQIDPELESYYWTGGKEWDSLIERLDRVTLSKRGDPGIFVANQASLPQKGQLTARAQFHRAPVELPSPQIQEDLWLL